jgi:hypothetical protein
MQPPASDDNPPTMDDMNRMTMELLLNKTHYAKYLAKTDKQKHAEFQQFVDSLRKFRDPLVDITQRLIREPKSTMFSQDMIDAFQSYAQTVIRFLEIQEDNPPEEEDDGDEMFPATMNRYTHAGGKGAGVTLDAFYPTSN